MLGFISYFFTMNLKKVQNFKRISAFLKECPNKLTFYPELKEDLKLLCSSEMKGNIKSDLPQILPGVLVLSTEESVVQEIVPLFGVISDIVSNNVSLKTEPWWREMENNIVPNKFFSGLTTLIERNSQFWSQIWIFAVSLMINDTQLQGSTVNSLLKIMEVAFKKSLTDTGSVMEKAFFCWIKFIEIFTRNPRILHSKKLIGLLIRPLTIPMGPKSHFKIIETYKLIFEKVGNTEDKNIVTDIINSFIEYSYMKDGDSFSKTHPNKCCEILLELICEKNTYRNMYILPVLSVFTHCVESRALQALLLKLWPSILDSSDIVDPSDYEQYLEEIIAQRQKILQNTEVLKDYELFREQIINHELPLITPELLDKLLISNALSPKILADLLEYNDFRTKTLANYFNQFVNNVNTEVERKETSCAAQMEAWDTFCAAFNLFVDSKGYQFQETDSHTFKPLILFPLQTHAKWTGITQRSWHSLIDLVEKIGILKLIIPDIISTLNLNMESNKVNTSTVIDIITHLVNIDKTVNFVPTVDNILAKLPVDDPKNAIDLLAFVENLIGHGDKKQYLSGVLSELLRVCTCYDQLYEHRIRTKVSKLHRKLITDSKAEIGDKNKDSRTPSPKIRSPLMTGSNFLHRLAKSEEKKASTSVSLGLGDRNMKNTLKSNKDLASNKCKDSGDKVISKDKEKEETMAIKEEITLPKTVNIVITNNTMNNVNNVPIIKTPEDNLKLNRKLQNGDCRLTSTTKKSVNSKRTAISYFEDDSQEFVVVASKPKAKTPLTEHQKEKMLLRTSDIPALYQDLSQDTQSISSIIEKNTPEIVITSEDKKTLSSEGKNAENQDQVNRSLDVIEVTPPAQNLLITPTKSSPYMTASKKLNFDGLVKANSPAQGDMHTSLQETKNDLEENCINTPSRRVSHRKTTSKYGVNRVITPTKDSDDISNENSVSSSEGLNKKTFVKQERSGKKLKQEDDLITEKKKELSLMNEKCDIDIKNVEDLKCNLESTLAVSSSRIEDSLECNDKLRKKEKERSNAGKKPKLDVSSSRERTGEKNEKIDEKQDTNENSVKNEKLQENKENNCNEKSIVENSEAKKVEEKEDFKPTQSDKLIKSALVSGIAQVKIQLHKTSHGEPIKSTNVKISPDTEGGKDDKSEVSSSVRNAKHNNSDGSTTTTPSSQRTGRRPRKLPPTPFSPKLTRSKKLSLQGKDKSPKSPKDTKTKIRAPKPNTECFSSDSNDSLTGITPLEKNTGRVYEQVTVNNSLKCIHEAYPVKVTNEEHLEKAVVNIVTEGKINEESMTEEMKPTSPNPLEECNENSEPKKLGRKRKFQPSPEANDHNNSEIKIVNSSKKGKKRKTLGNNRANSHSPRLSSGLEHWLYKKDKDLTQNIDVNKESSVDKEDKSVNKDLMSSICSVNAFPTVVNSTSTEKMSSEDKSPTEISHEEQLVENVKSENNRLDKIESTKGDMQLMSVEECDTEIISTEELKANDSQNLELVSNEIIASSQDVEYSDDIFGSMLKKVKLSLPDEMEAKCISTQLNKVSSDITIKETPSDKSLECSKANDVSSTVTKVEKIANGMKACDLIFKVAELEEKITIYMEEPPITATRDVEMNQEENENQDAPADSPEIPAQEVVASSQIEQRSLNNEKSGQNIMVSETYSERTENPQTNSLMATSMEAVQMINNCVDTFISAKNSENIKTIELHEKNIVVITSDEESSPCKSNEKSCTMKDELLTVEIKQNNGNDEVIVDTEVAKGKSRDNVSPDKLKTEKLSETLNNESQNDSEHIFKSDTPKKRGARFIHTTEKEEDGGDTAEDRRRRNFRSKGTNLDDKNSLGSSGRSKHMVQLAQQGRHSRINTPRRRPSIVPITYGSNWPTGPTEEWVGVRPSTPGHCLSPGILKSSPASSPGTSIVSPPPKKKRVNFLDPPVSKGLLYQKGTKIGIGQLQYAETSPSKKRLLNREEEVSEKKMKIINSDDEGKELEPAFEVEISSDESIEMLPVTDSEISENNSLNEVDSTVSQSSAEKSENRSEKSVDVCENISGSILENICKKSESISDKSNFPILAVSEDVEILTEKPNENLEVDVTGEIYSKIPTEDELKIYANNQQFLNNLASCLNANGEPLSWLQRLLTLIVVGSKK